MKTVFKGKKISTVLGVLPETVSYFDDEVNQYTFPAKQTMRLKKIMGYESHRLAREDSFASDFCMYGIRYLLDKNVISRDEIGAIIVVTLSPDYFLPQISNMVQGELGFSKDTLCLDIAQGCCGFLIGLMQACMLLEYMGNKKVLLCNVDVLSKKVSKCDRNDYPLCGDGASVTIIENDDTASDIYYTMHMDGSRRNALHIPAGGFRRPNTPETGKLEDAGDGNLRALDHLHMDGTEVFSFVQNEVPPCIGEILQFARTTKEEIDYYIFHQPNQFMLQKLREKLGVSDSKMPSDLVKKYGNPSGVSIPMAITDHFSDVLTKETMHKCCLSAFGSGLAWGAMVIELGGLSWCELIESNL